MTTGDSESSSKISDITECSICSETFKEPKMLPCIHTFCLQCLEKCCAKKKQGEMPCPLCSKVFTIPPGGIKHLTDNFFLNELLLQQNDEPKSAKRVKLSVPDYCNQHPTEENNLYCADCKTIVCPKCISKHNNHKLSDLSSTVKELKKQIKDDVDKVTVCVAKEKDEIEKLVTEKNNILEKVSSMKKAISQRHDERITLLQSHKSQLLDELKKFKEKFREKMKNKKDDVERNFMIKENFVGYCSDITEKGTPGTICRSTHDLRARAEEFGMTSYEHGNQLGNKAEITFTPSHSITDNLIGQMTYSEEDRLKILNALSFMDNPRLHVVACVTGGVTGITVMANQLFVAAHAVEVYDTDSLKFIRKLEIPSSWILSAIVASPRYDCLFVSTVTPSVFNRYNLSDDVISSWPLCGECNSLSMTSTGNVLVLLHFISQVREYTPDGSLVRQISLDGSIQCPWHCVQLSSERLIVSHGLSMHDKSLHRVCMVDLNGRIIHSYGGFKGSGVGELDTPSSVAVDRFGNVLVSDRCNARLVFLSPTLTYLGTKSIPTYVQSRTSHLHLDELTGRLYIAEWPSDSLRVFVFTV